MTSRSTRRRGGWKRRAAVWVVACAVLGLVTTVSVAWWLDRTAGGSPRDYQSIDIAGEFRVLRSAHSDTGFMMRGYVVMPAAEEFNYSVEEAPVLIDELPHSQQKWGRFDVRDLPTLSPEQESWVRSGAHVRMFESGVGWPQLALRYERTGADGQPMTRRGEWLVDRKILGVHLSSPPIIPIWPGLLIDTAFWGGVWFVLLWPMGLVAGKVKRARRRKRGKCAWCRYDLRGIDGDVCPECGGKRKAAGNRHQAAEKQSPREHTEGTEKSTDHNAQSTDQEEKKRESGE